MIKTNGQVEVFTTTSLVMLTITYQLLDGQFNRNIQFQKRHTEELEGSQMLVTNYKLKLLNNKKTLFYWCPRLTLFESKLWSFLTLATMFS